MESVKWWKLTFCFNMKIFLTLFMSIPWYESRLKQETRNGVKENVIILRHEDVTITQ